MWPSQSVSPDWWRFGVRPRNAPTLRDFRNLAGSSIAVMNAKAVKTPTPGMLIRWRHMAFSLACSMTSRSSLATCSLTVFRAASKLRTDASSRSLPCEAAITCYSKDWLLRLRHGSVVLAVHDFLQQMQHVFPGMFGRRTKGGIGQQGTKEIEFRISLTGKCH